MTYQEILTEKRDGVLYLTLNRPEKHNALTPLMLEELLDALHQAKTDAEVGPIVIKGAGRSFCSGWDISPSPDRGAAGEMTIRDDIEQMAGRSGRWSEIWHLNKPVIAQVHGYCLAGGSELATGCDLIYMAEDAQMGYPAVRFGVPDMQFHAWLVGMRRGMEMMLTGDSIDGIEAEKRGWATRAFPADQLEAKTLEMAERIASLPPDIVQLNKRAVHRQMSVMGLREGIRQGTELCTLATHQKSFQEFIVKIGPGKGRLTSALQERDEKFGDYRTSEGK